MISLGSGDVVRAREMVLWCKIVSIWVRGAYGDMPDDYIDTYFFRGRWWNRVVTGSSDYVVGHATEEEAVAHGDALARAGETEHFVRDRECQIVSHQTFRYRPGADAVLPARWARRHVS